MLGWFGSTEELYRQIDVIGPRADVPADAGPLDTLVARFGRKP